MAHEAVHRVRDALHAGVLSTGDLTARGLAQYLGATTSLFYHHFGSLDGFLSAVSRSAFDKMESSLEAFERRPPVRHTFEDFAAHYLSFAVHQPALYQLMFERPYAWKGDDTERRTGPGRVKRALVRQFSRRGSSRPIVDAHAFHASLHGLAALAHNGPTPASEAERDCVEAAKRLVGCMLAR